jgi:hypothetical protein
MNWFTKVLMLLVLGFAGCDENSENVANSETDQPGSDFFCYGNMDCDDNDPCTEDRCFNNDCFHCFTPSDNYKQGSCGLHSYLYMDYSVVPAVPACGLKYNDKKTIDTCNANGCYTQEVLCPSLLELGVECIFKFDCEGDASCADGVCLSGPTSP